MSAQHTPEQDAMEAYDALWRGREAAAGPIAALLNAYTARHVPAG